MGAFFQKEIETMPRRQLQELQLENLKWAVKHCYENIKFYHDRLDAAGVTPEKIKTLSDLQYIPFTTKADIRDQYPFGLFAVPMRQIVRLHASSGTTGKPTVVGYTRKDLDTWSDLVARILVAGGATQDDINISFGYGLFTGALGLHGGLEKLGATVVPSSSGNTQKQLMLMKDFGVTALIATPSYAMYMAETAQELGYKKEDFSLRLAFLGSEGCTPELREKIEEAWGIFVTDNYGMSELMGPGVSGECEYRQGLHFAEDHFIPEIIDPDTLQQKAPGETGELVITTITKEGFPMLRYRTKDITRLNYEPCPCGRTHVRMDKVKGRSDDMLKIRGVNVFPSRSKRAHAHSADQAPAISWCCAGKLYGCLQVNELNDASLLERYAELEKLQNTVHNQLKTVLGIESKVLLVEPKSLERFAGKAKRIVDLREEKEEPKK
ncbi:MAG: phenylacetate--CoA ligase family protein [Oscillospiraceae bacterium]